MQSIIINKQVLAHPDFSNSFVADAKALLNALIDAEIEKGDLMDCDFIDECIDALEEINAPYDRAAGVILSLANDKRFNTKARSLAASRFIKVAVAACVIVSVAVGADFFVEKATGIELGESLVSFVREVFGIESVTQASTTAPPQTTAAARTLTDIELLPGEGMRFDYYIGEKPDLSTLKVIAHYSDGSQKTIPVADCKYNIPSDFGETEGEVPIPVTYGGITQTLTLRVLVGIDTVVFESIYVKFEDDFDFTVEDISNPMPPGSSVIAVYSDGSEKRIDEGDYTVEITDMSNIRTKKAMVTVKYEGSSASFIVTEE